MQRLEVSCAVRRIYTLLGAKGLTVPLLTSEGSSVRLVKVTVKLPSYFDYITLLVFSVCLVRQ